MSIEYIRGDLFEGIRKVSQDTTVVIPHICNDIGVAGSGFVIPLFKMFPQALMEYASTYQLGRNSYHWTSPDKPCGIIVNMVAQHGISSKSTGPDSEINKKPIRYESLVYCMKDMIGHLRCANSINQHLRDIVEIHCPKFGSLRAGGNWDFIKELIEEIWVDYKVVVYDIGAK